MSKKTKIKLHPKNKNRMSYDMEALQATHPALSRHVIKNRQDRDSIDFADPRAVKCLNQALLHHFYGIAEWSFPSKHLCPPIPGRADYIHYLADILKEEGRTENIKVLDIGTGATLIYPILGIVEYDWTFITSDCHKASLETAEKIIELNEVLQNKIECRLQNDATKIFEGVIKPNDQIDICMCNPPFHASAEEANKANQRKIKNLSGEKKKKLNFSGIQSELIYPGGEKTFIANMIAESKHYAKQIKRFSCLVSKEANLKSIYALLDEVEADAQTITMGTANKKTRIVIWNY